jgi:hypothetical protein
MAGFLGGKDDNFFFQAPRPGLRPTVLAVQLISKVLSPGVK